MVDSHVQNHIKNEECILFCMKMIGIIMDDPESLESFINSDSYKEFEAFTAKTVSYIADPK